VETTRNVRRRKPPAAAARKVSENEEERATQRARAAKIQEKMKLAEQRHFVRRYQVAHQFIQSAFQQLRLDENPTAQRTLHKELLPRLDQLLEPSQPSTKQQEAQQATTSAAKDILEHPEEHAEHKAQQLHRKTSSLHKLEWVQDNESLQTYLEHFSKPKKGMLKEQQPAYQCLCWLLFSHLLHADQTGYDARVRYWIKTVAVTLWVQHMELSASSSSEQEEKDTGGESITLNRVARATRKMEDLEHQMAQRLLSLASASSDTKDGAGAGTTTAKRKSSVGQNIWRGLQIGSVGVVAGTLLAVTGGLAAPGIAAGLAALGMGAVAGTLFNFGQFRRRRILVWGRGGDRWPRIK
jgi:hypothetical protein